MAVDKAVINLILNTKDAQRSLRSFMTQMRGLNIIGRELSTIFRGAGIVASAIAIGRMAINASKFAKEMDVAAQKLGLASSRLVSMKSAFDAIGANGKNIEQVFNKIHQGMQSFKYGDGKFISQLAAMGVGAFSGGRQKTDEEVLYGIMDAAQRMRQQGRSQQEVADWLQRTVGADFQIALKMMMGSVAFKKWQRGTSEKTGIVQQRQLDNLTKLNESFSALGVTLNNLKNQIFGDLSPAISFSIDAFQAFVRMLQDVWMPISSVFRELGRALGGEDGLNFMLEGLKSSLEYGFIIPLKMIAVFFKYLIKGIRQLGEVIGSVIAWLQDKFGWIVGRFNDDEKMAAKKMVTEALVNKEITGKEAVEAFKKIDSGNFAVEKINGKIKVTQLDTIPFDTYEYDYVDEIAPDEFIKPGEVTEQPIIQVTMNNEVNVDKQGRAETNTGVSASSGITEEKVSNVTKT